MFVIKLSFRYLIYGQWRVCGVIDFTYFLSTLRAVFQFGLVEPSPERDIITMKFSHQNRITFILYGRHYNNNNNNDNDSNNRMWS